jgi:hypothetical protein
MVSVKVHAHDTFTSSSRLIVSVAGTVNLCHSLVSSSITLNTGRYGALFLAYKLNKRHYNLQEMGDAVDGEVDGAWFEPSH